MNWSYSVQHQCRFLRYSVYQIVIQYNFTGKAYSITRVQIRINSEIGFRFSEKVHSISKCDETGLRFGETCLMASLSLFTLDYTLFTAIGPFDLPPESETNFTDNDNRISRNCKIPKNDEFPNATYRRQIATKMSTNSAYFAAARNAGLRVCSATRLRLSGVMWWRPRTAGRHQRQRQRQRAQRAPKDWRWRPHEICSQPARRPAGDMRNVRVISVQHFTAASCSRPHCMQQICAIFTTTTSSQTSSRSSKSRHAAAAAAVARSNWCGVTYAERTDTSTLVSPNSRKRHNGADDAADDDDVGRRPNEDVHCPLENVRRQTAFYIPRVDVNVSVNQNFLFIVWLKSQSYYEVHRGVVESQYKTRKWLSKKKCFRRWRKTGRDGDDWMSVGSEFHRSDAATGKELRPTVVSRNGGTSSCCDDEERHSRWWYFFTFLDALRSSVMT